jgi:uncharacterized membrane protein
MLLALVPPSAGIRVAPLDTYGAAVRHGAIPYRDFSLEYPPGALPAIVVPALVPGVSYPTAFRALEAIFGAALIISVAFAVRHFPYRSYALSLSAVAAMPLLLGPVVFFRFDLWPSALTLLGLAAFLAGRESTGGASIGVAVAAKLYPVTLVLPFALEARRRLATRRAFAAGAIAFGVVTLPFAILAPRGVGSSLLHQAGRQLQIESVGGSLAALASVLGVDGFSTRFEDGAFDIHGPGVTAIQRSFTAVGFICLLALWAVIWFRRGTFEPGITCAALVGIVLVWSKVLSPQYLIWFVPLVAIVGGRSGALSLGLISCAEVITQVLYPSHYEALVALKPTEVSLLLARNALLIAATGILVHAAVRSDRSEPVGEASRPATPAAPTVASPAQAHEGS